MDENKKKDFWASSDDDFWNKPVASDEWLKNTSSTRATENPYLKPEEPAVTEPIENTPQKKPEINDTSWYHNPYEHVQEQTAAPKQQAAVRQKKFVQPEIRQTILNGQVLDKPKKKIHIHTIICLSFIALAILSIVGAVATYFGMKQNAIKIAENVSYEEKEISASFMFDEYNAVTLGEEAVVMVSEVNFTGFPKGQKLIAISADVSSVEYISGAHIMRDLYIGYEIDGRPYYQSMPREDTVFPYVSGLGVAREEILDNYGIGNGIDESGYFFFFIPAEVEEITLYIPKTYKKSGIDVIDSVRYITMPVSELSIGEEADR